MMKDIEKDLSDIVEVIHSYFPFSRDRVQVGDRLLIKDINSKTGKRFIGLYEEQPIKEQIYVKENDKNFWYLQPKSTYINRIEVNKYKTPTVSE